MKQRLLTLLLACFALFASAAAQEFVNLTPKPKSLTQGDGSLTLPTSFTVGYTGLDEAMTTEVTRFVEALNATTNSTATMAADASDALIQVTKSSSLTRDDAYTLNVTTTGVKIEAQSALGLFYAFQSVKKMLPANVMAAVKDEKVTTYSLPCVTISDEPRFDYRGFMLDVSRHFFTVEEVKRMLDVMSYYKLNKFHWHLSDDQGWRVEIKKYPKLTTVGATASNSRFTDMYTCTEYWINKAYGPYFYSQEEIKDVVAYAEKLHIDIIPEIDMPGHFCAAMAAYPEYSCTPDGGHSVQTSGGIYSDVLNVGNEAAVQFAKDILAELCELFPGEYINIGGDECPTSAWQNNADCQAKYKELGLTDYRQLQSHFIKDMGDFLAEKGKKLAVWNEAITAANSDTELVKETDATVYCWTGAEAASQKAATLGLKNIFTPWGPYYINRKQGDGSFTEPAANGSGGDDVKATYNQSIPSTTDYGIQGTFWTERVSDNEYMEWLALPRLIAIAEAGWTPQASRSFTDFQQRMTADTLLLDYNNYKYTRYHMLVENNGFPETVTDETIMPKASTTEAKYYYRLISGGTDATRKDRCIELLADGSSLITQYASNNASAGKLWTNTQAAEGDTNYDYQWWYVEKDPNGSGKYALVCKAKPDGSVSGTPTAKNNTGRWSYDDSAKNYNFSLGTGGTGAVGDNYYFTIESDQATGWYMNSSMSGQGLAVNLWSDATSGGGGQWQFSPLSDYGWDGGTTSDPITFDGLEAGKTYTFTNNVEGFEGITLSDDNANGSVLTHSTDAFAANAWTVTEAGEKQTDGTQTLTLQNATTQRYVGATTSRVSGQGYPVSASTTAATVTLKYDTDNAEYRLLVDGHSLFPLPAGTISSGATIDDVSYDAPRLQGAGWLPTEVRIVTLNCVDDQGATLGTYKRSVPVATTSIDETLCPIFQNTIFSNISETTTDTYTVTYTRTAYTLTIKGVDAKGAIVTLTDTAVAVGKTYIVEQPKEVPYFTFVSSDTPIGTALTLTKDTTIITTYSTEAYVGAKALGTLVTANLTDGMSYLLYDASTDNNGSRAGYRKITASNAVNRTTALDELTPQAVWTLEASGSGFKVKNEYASLYVPLLARSTATTAAATGGVFAFTLNSDGETWCIKGSNGQMWDGLADGNLVGWDSGTGHPIKIYTYWAQPYFDVTLNCVDTSGKALQTSKTLVKAGEPYTLVTPAITGYAVQSVSGGNEGLDAVTQHTTITITYQVTASGIAEAVTTGATAPRTIYDLQGRRLTRIPSAGIYIIGGKKVIVK